MAALVGGRYEVLRELERGGMSEVALARQIKLDRLVVLKRVARGRSDRFVAALLEEARVAARLHHPGIVSVLDVSADGEPPYVALEYVAGVTLREMIEQAPRGLPLEVALVIAYDVLRSLAYAHGVKHGSSVGLVHRDIKPRNIMVTFAGATKLIDFGISRWLSEGGWEATSVSGTEGYMAPEQCSGQRVDGRADQYAVGVTLREMLTGKPPIDREAATTESRPGARRAPAIATELDSIVDRACAPDPDDRFESCEAMADALEREASERGIALSPRTVERWIAEHLPERIAAFERESSHVSEPTSTKASPAPPPAVPATRRSRRRLLLFLFPLALAAAGATIALVVRFAHPGSAATPAPIVSFAAASASDGAEDWLALAIEHMAWRAMRDVEHRPYWIAPARDARTTVTIELRYRRTPGGIQLEAWRGGTQLASAEARSVFDALAQLSAPLARTFGERAAGPDAHEARQMVLLGARTYEAYRRFRILFEDARIPGWFDSTIAIAGHEALLRDDPGWGHVYAELDWLYGRSTPRASQNRAAARAHADRGRDPDGLALLEALHEETIDRQDLMLKLAGPVFERNNWNMLAGELVNAAYDLLHRPDEARAVNRRLLELYPAMFYAGDIASHLEREGRDADAERFIRDTIAAAPDNLTAARELVRLEARRGDLAAARRAAERAQLIHGARPLAQAELYDMMIACNELSEAQRIVDLMLLGSPLARARGRYRTAVIAALQGRFATAFQEARRAVEEFGPFGTEAETGPALVLMRAIAPIISADRAALALEQAAFEDGLVTGNSRSPVLRYQAALEPGKCPAPGPFLGDATGERRELLAARMERYAAAAGCADCRAVVARGLSAHEDDTEALVAFGACARKVGQLELARRVFERASQHAVSFSHKHASPVHAVRARFQLARVLAELGDQVAARREHERFLSYWGNAERTLPEVAAARAALAAP